MTDELDAVTREQAGRDPNWPADWRARADSAGVEDVNRLATVVEAAWFTRQLGMPGIE